MGKFRQFAVEDFGNPSSSHALGQRAARAIQEARNFFAVTFQVGPEQVVFTGSGTESDNLAIQGIALARLSQPGRVLASATDHPAVRKTVLALAELGFDCQLIPVDRQGQIDHGKYLELLTPATQLVSIQQVNNITGAIHPVEELARVAKQRVPGLVFHTDSVQAFGKILHPIGGTSVDLVSISAHKVRGPKGVGALIILDRKLLADGLRPLIWGGEQEGGLRSGTQNAGLIAGFHAAAALTLSRREQSRAHAERLLARLRGELEARELAPRAIAWNSLNAVPQIASFSVPALPGSGGPLSRLLEERGFLVSTGSACSSTKPEPDPVLKAMGLPHAACTSALRISFSELTTEDEVTALAAALEESIRRMALLTGKRI
ncbi:MAG: cysteine desulfurase [Oligoflexia bacterium]|nr:cysteine desulfurase [Oligoflexia bacterium]